MHLILNTVFFGTIRHLDRTTDKLLREKQLLEINCQSEFQRLPPRFRFDYKISKQFFFHLSKQFAKKNTAISYFCFVLIIRYLQLKISTTSGIHLSSYIPSTEWELIQAQAVIEYNPFDEEGGYSFVQFQIKIQRKSLYYIVNLILPCIMLSLVMLFGQYLPCNSGEGINFITKSLLVIEK